MAETDENRLELEMKAEVLRLRERLAALGVEAAELRATVETLREEEAKFRAITESNTCGIFIYQEERIRYLNPALQSLIGYTQEEISQIHFLDFVHPDCREFMRQRGLARERGDTAPADYDLKVVSKSGEERWLEISTRYIEFEGRPGILGTAIDRTARKLAEDERTRLLALERTARATAQEALQSALKNEARFRRLVESNITGILLADHERIVETNDSFLKLLGYSREEFQRGGLFWSAINAPEYAHRDVTAFEELRAHGACTPFEKEHIRKDGSRAPVLVGMVALDEVPSTYVSLVLDLSERKRLEARLTESQKLESLGVLAGGLAHDYNNLLTTIIGNASLALDELTKGRPVELRIRKILQAGDRATELTRQLVAYSGTGQLVMRPIDLSGLVNETARLIEATIPKAVQLRLRLAEELPCIEADHSHMQRLVTNLVINGVEAIGEASGAVEIATGVREVNSPERPPAVSSQDLAPGKYVCLEVQDSGSGMDPATQGRIFDPFFTTKFMGRGLGLAAAQGIVRSHHGIIQVHSEPGRGSTFTVLFPALESKTVS